MLAQRKNLALATLESTLETLTARAGVTGLADVDAALLSLRAAFDADPESLPETQIRDMWAMLAALNVENLYNISRVFYALSGYVTQIDGIDAVWFRNGDGALEYSTDDRASWRDSFPPEAHDHHVADIEDFPATMPPTLHAHLVEHIVDFPDMVTPAPHVHDYSDLQDVPEMFVPQAHAHTTQDVQLCVIEGDGTGNIASGGRIVKDPRQNTGIVSLCMVVTPYSMRSEALFDRETNPGELHWSFGRLDSGRLFVDTADANGHVSRTESDEIFLSWDLFDKWGTPVEVGFMIDRDAGKVAFFLDGVCSAWKNCTGALREYSQEGAIVIGRHAVIDFFWAVLASGRIRNPGMVHTPFPLNGANVLIPNAYAIYTSIRPGMYYFEDKGSGHRLIVDGNIAIYQT